MLTRRWAVCAACFALGMGLIMGLRADNPTEVILTRSLLAMIGFYFLGSIAGTIADTVVAERNARLLAEAAGDVAEANKEAAGHAAESGRQTESDRQAGQSPLPNQTWQMVDAQAPAEAAGRTKTNPSVAT